MDAIVPIYSGKNIIHQTIAETVQMMVVARGTSGSCLDYVKGVTNLMRESGIDDPAVSELSAEIAKLDHA